MKKVIISMDFDPSVKKVAEAGFALANSMKAEVILLHVIADSTYYSSLESTPIMGYLDFSSTTFSTIVDTDGITQATQYFLDKYKKTLGNETTKTMIGNGDIAKCILKTAKHEHADLIVMGSHSRKWLEQILIGSVTEEVLNHSTIPLYIIPTKKQNS